MKDQQHLHIAIASDENYARFVAIVIASVLDNNKSFDRISFHLLSNGIEINTIKKISEAVDPGNSELKVYDISDLPTRLGITVPPSIALTSYARLFMEELISHDVSQILYLDTDIVVNGDLRELWATDLGNNYVGGCLDIFSGTTFKTDVGLLVDDPYINSGMLLINLDMWRRHNIANKFVKFLFQHNGNIYHADQGIINGVCKGRITIFPPEYNVFSTVLSYQYNVVQKIMKPYYSEDSYLNARANPVILHYTEGFYNRPWKRNCVHPYKETYLKYASMTAWKNYSLMPDNRSLVVKILSYIFLKFPYPVYRCATTFVECLQRLKCLKIK